MPLDSPINEFIWRARRTSEAPWDHPYLPKPTGPWAVVRYDAAQVPSGGEIQMTVSTRKAAEEASMLLASAYWAGRCLERRYWEAKQCNR